MWSVVGLVVLGAMACNPTPGEGYFEAESFTYGTCEEQILPWEPGFYTVDVFEDLVTVRLQTIGGNLELVDGMYFQIDKSYAEAHLREDIPMGSPIQEGDEEPRVRVRGVMGFYQSCPDHGAVIPELHGRINFRNFEPTNDGQVTATVEADEIIDQRTGKVLGTNMVGSFSFLVQRGRPYSNFTGPGN